jgi:beta-lactamase superfamily II metal-dependent hydrolase
MLESEPGQSSLPLSSVDSALLAVEDHGVIDRLEIETLVSTIDMEIWLPSLHLSPESCQNDILARGNLLNKRVLLGEDERALKVSVVISRTPDADLLVAQSSSSSASNSVVLVKAHGDFTVVESVGIARA